MTQQLTLLGDGPLHQIQADIRARLETYFPTTKFGHAILPARITDTIWNELVRRTPFIGLAWLGWAAKGGGKLYRGPVKFALYVVVENPRPDTIMTGDAAKPIGIYGMAQLAAAVLQGYRTRHGSLQVTGIGNIFADDWGKKDQAIGGVDFQIDDVELTDPPAAAEIDEFLRMQNDWDIDGAQSRDTISIRTS
ncbi:hypothetical protein [Acidisoma sp. 7E03]